MTTQQPNESALDLGALQHDGDTLELRDGRTLRLRIEPDDTNYMDDPDEFYGTVAWVERDRDTGYDKTRPAGFGGTARKLLANRHGDRVWWQPPTDGPTPGTPEFDKMSEHLQALLEFGYVGVILEVLDGTDAYNRPIVTKAQSLWRIESDYDPEYLAEVVRDLANELGLTGPA